MSTPRASVTGYAERALFGTTLDDKLAIWPDVDVRARRVVGGTTAPGRPASLALPTSHRRLPSVWSADLDRADGRSRVLHELMNHELQAIELIAMALLRWPEAPAGFQRGLVATLRDEQRHCALYRDRLLACGGTVGEVPVSRFFWDTLGPIDTVERFVAGLSLCFEVANLDFCTTWRTRFAQAGDADTAAVLDIVYEDEIRHVAHGLVWFSRWTDDDRIDAWQAQLPSPLTPARSRGPRFDAEGRLRAGFLSSEVERLRVLGGSRGRPGRVLLFDAGIEDAVAGRPISRMARAVSQDLAVLPMVLCVADDTVIAEPPPPAFCTALADAGFAIPRFVPSLDAERLRAHAVSSVEFWGPAPHNAVPSDLSVLTDPVPWDPRWRALSSKTETARQAAALDTDGLVDDLGSVWSEPHEPSGRWVLKAPFSTSGTERIRGEGPLSAAHQRWLDTQLTRHGEVLYQPWFDRVLDLSVHVTVSADDLVIDGISRFVTGPGGAYSGAWLGRWTRGLPSDLQRAIHGGSGGPPIEPILHTAARHAGRWAQSLGFVGELSIDALVVQTPDGLRVHPWLETNARRSLGRVALALASHVDSRSAGWWRVERYTPDAAEALQSACSERPVEMRHGRIRSGVLPTTPVQTASSLLTWLDITSP